MKDTLKIITAMTLLLGIIVVLPIAGYMIKQFVPTESIVFGLVLAVLLRKRIL